MAFMNVLAFDTCWKACSAALVQFRGEEPTVLAHRFEEMTTGQAEALPVMLADLFEQSDLSVQDLHRVAVPNGPGSFTGVRIGIAAARALNLSSEAVLVTCSSLEVLAWGLRKKIEDATKLTAHELLVAMDARRGEAYVQLFSQDPTMQAITEPQLLALPQAAKLGSKDRVCVAGSAAEAVADEIEKSGRSAKVVDIACVPDALDLAQVAPQLAPLSELLMPVYLRPPDAKPSTKLAIQRTTL